MSSHTMIQLEAADGHRLEAYCARPTPSSTSPAAALVVVQELFGVNGHIRSLCDRFAAEGYLAIAPALYDRVETAAELPYGPDGVARGREIRKHIDDDTALMDVRAAAERACAEVGAAGKVGVIGYCWGGTLAWLAAARFRNIAAAVGYYGSGIAGYLNERPKVPLMLHFGLKDAHIPVSDVEKIKAAVADTPIYQYDAGHGFNCDDRASYDPASARLANERTREFLAKHLLK
jgi:carboxymethylenebutenolidase